MREACAGGALAERCDLAGLVEKHLTLPAHGGGVNAHLKVGALVGAMVAGADSIAGTDLLRHGAMRRLLGGVRAPSTLGTFLRCFTFGHVRQLDAVAGRLLAQLAGRSPLLPGADQVVWVDIDDTVKATYGYAKQGAGHGYSPPGPSYSKPPSGQPPRADRTPAPTTGTTRGNAGQTGNPRLPTNSHTPKSRSKMGAGKISYRDGASRLRIRSL